MAQGRKKNARRRGTSQTERKIAQAQRQAEKQERKDRISHVVIVVFAIILALGMVIPSLASIFSTNNSGYTEGQTITDSQGNVYTIGADGSLTLTSTPSVEEIDAQYTETIADLEKAIESNEQDTETLNSLAQNYLNWAYRIGNAAESDDDRAHANELYEKSLEYYDKSLAVEPSSEVATNKAMVHYYAGDVDTAISELTALLDSEDYASAWANLGLLYEYQGQTDDALSAYERAMAADPDDAEGAYSYAESRIASINGTSESDTADTSGTVSNSGESLSETLAESSGIGF